MKVKIYLPMLLLAASLALIALARAQDTSPELKAKVLLELLSYIGAKPARGVAVESGKPLDLESVRAFMRADPDNDE